MNKRDIRTVIFDLDGTLTDTLESLTYSVNLTLHELGADSITDEQCSAVLVTQDPVGVSIISKRVGEVLDENVKTIPATHVTSWLVDNGYLVENVYSGKKKKVTTPKGEQLGILTVDAVNPQGVPYKKNLYDSNAQRFIISNLNKITADIAAKKTAATE